MNLMKFSTFIHFLLKFLHYNFKNYLSLKLSGYLVQVNMKKYSLENKLNNSREKIQIPQNAGVRRTLCTENFIMVWKANFFRRNDQQMKFYKMIHYVKGKFGLLFYAQIRGNHLQLQFPAKSNGGNWQAGHNSH